MSFLSPVSSSLRTLSLFDARFQDLIITCWAIIHGHTWSSDQQKNALNGKEKAFWTMIGSQNQKIQKKRKNYRKKRKK